MPDSTKKKSASETELTPTSITDWRNSRFKLFILPSGNIIKLKRVALIDLIAQGEIPDTLSGLAANVVSKSNLSTLSVEDLKRYAEIVDIVVLAAAAEPKIARTGSDEALGIDEIPWVDKTQIFAWCNGLASALRPF